MSDFIFMKEPIKKGLLSQILQEIYGDISIEIIEFHSEYGCFAYSKNIYNGYNEYETEDFFFLIIGGPLLEFRDNKFLSIKGGNEGTKTIFDRWKIENQIIWDKDLNGPYVIICFNKINGDLEIVTDMLSFIPIYSFKSESNLVLSSHINIFGKIDNMPIDHLSIIDLIIHKVITFPYTIYDGVLQLEPASIYCINMVDNVKMNYETYWVPKELKNSSKKHKELVNRLRRSFKKYIDTIVESEANIGTFLSGGEDSRCVLSAIPISYPKDSFIFSNEKNYETQIASKVAKKLKSKLNIYYRKESHYLDIFKSVSNLIGSCGDIAHGHTYGIDKKLKLSTYDAILGGFLSDTLLKGHHIQTRKINRYLSFLPIPSISIKTLKYRTIKQKIFKNDLLEELNYRRQNRLKSLKSLRPNSAHEWFNIWPITMHLDYPNIHVNRRLFKSFEPFTTSEIIKVSAEASNRMKLNRKLFRDSMKPLLYKTIIIPHVNGSIPFFPWYLNNIFKYIETIRKKILWLLFFKRTECSYSDWNELFKMEKANTLQDDCITCVEKFGKNIFINDFNYDIINNPDLSTDQKRIIIQLGFQLKTISQHATNLKT